MADKIINYKWANRVSSSEQFNKAGKEKWRLLKIEIKDDGFDVHMTRGELTKEQRQVLADALASFLIANVEDELP